MKFTFRSHERLRRSSDFLRARRRGRRRVGRFLVVWSFRREERPLRASRLGISVGRKAGGAVSRNLFKRRMREIFRLNKADIRRGWDFVASPKAGMKTFPPSWEELRRDFLDITKSSQIQSESSL